MDRRDFIFFSAAGVASALVPGVGLAGLKEPVPCGELPPLPRPASPETTPKLFPGFTAHTVKTRGASIFLVKGGTGPPLLLLHGHPETHVTWHKIASKLAHDFTVIASDLRGYGDSSKPEGGERHANYSSRASARDQIEVMQSFGFDRFDIVGHDRGARVAYRLALDHPKRVRKLCLMDIAPTLTMYRGTNQEFATRYVWWFFQIQPFPLPEHYIGLDPAYYLKEHLEVQCKTPGAVTPEAMAEYLRCYGCKETIHAVCEDYRAAATIELEWEEEEEKAGKKIVAPLLVLWGAKGVVGQLWDVLAVWRAKATNVSGKALDCGHLLPEERPDEVVSEVKSFLHS